MLILTTMTIPESYSTRFVGSLVAKGDSDYHTYEFRRHDEFGICLFLDGILQSAQSDQQLFNQKLVRAALEENPLPTDILIIGGAGGGVLHQLFKSSGCMNCRIVVVDIDQKLFHIARRFMRTWANDDDLSQPCVETVFANGRDYLRTTQQDFDVIILDVGDPLPHTRSNDIYSPLVLRDIARVLRPGGVVSFHTAPAHTHDNVFVAESLHGKCSLRKTSHFLTDIPSFERAWMFNTLKKHTL